MGRSKWALDAFVDTVQWTHAATRRRGGGGGGEVVMPACEADVALC